MRTESSYFSNQGQMQSYQELGIEEYIFLGGGCEICQVLMVRHLSYLRLSGSQSAADPPEL